VPEPSRVLARARTPHGLPEPGGGDGGGRERSPAPVPAPAVREPAG